MGNGIGYFRAVADKPKNSAELFKVVVSGETWPSRRQINEMRAAVEDIIQLIKPHELPGVGLQGFQAVGQIEVPVQEQNSDRIVGEVSLPK